MGTCQAGSYVSAQRLLLVLAVVAFWFGLRDTAKSSVARPPHPTQEFPCFDRPDTSGMRMVAKRRFAVWYDPSQPGSRGTAETVADALAGTISQKLSFMPPAYTDEQAKCGNGTTPGQLDFYLLPDLHESKKPVRGVAFPLAIDGVRGASGFAELEAKLPPKELVCTAAHEYFHVLQYRFTLGTRVGTWWMESTAVWAQFYVGLGCTTPGTRASQFMHQYSRDALENIRDPYTPWLWPLWLERKAGGPGAIREVFETIAAHGGSYPAAKAIAESTWDTEFPRFALREFNSGAVDEFKTWRATPSSTDVETVDLSLNGKPEARKSLNLRVRPGSAVLVQVSALDVNTRELQFDLGAFTSQAGLGAAVTVLQQPTLGPDPAARADVWGAGVEADWSKERKKTLCRDRKDDDFQQVVLAFTNTNPLGDLIKAKVSFRSRMACPWTVKLDYHQTGIPELTPDSLTNGSTASATGNLDARWRTFLRSVESPMSCVGANDSCLPLIGRDVGSVAWQESETTVTYDQPVPCSYCRTDSTHVASVATSGAFQHAEDPEAGELSPSALFQYMKWDASTKRFKPVIRITFVGLRSDRMEDVPDGLYRASVASATWHSERDFGQCLSQVDTAIHSGALTHDEKCGADQLHVSHGFTATLTAGPATFGDPELAADPLPFTPCFAVLPYAKPNDGAGICLEFELEPYQSTWTDTYTWDSQRVLPPAAGYSIGWGFDGDCEQDPEVACSVGSDLDFHHWSTHATLKYTLALAQP